MENISDDTSEAVEELTEEIFGLDPEAVYRYVPKRARKLPVEKQPVFLLKIMSAREVANIQNNTVSVLKDETMRVLSGNIMLSALENGVKGWENFKLKNGEPVPFRENAGKPRPDAFDFLPVWLRQELSNAITSGADLSEQAEKNSGSQSADS